MNSYLTFHRLHANVMRQVMCKIPMGVDYLFALVF